MLAVNVKGGTNAGRRIIRQPAKSWTHVCAKYPYGGGLRMDACFSRCPDCGTRRP